MRQSWSKIVIFLCHLYYAQPLMVTASTLEDPVTRGTEPLNPMWDHWTSVHSMRGRKQPLEITGYVTTVYTTTLKNSLR